MASASEGRARRRPGAVGPRAPAALLAAALAASACGSGLAPLPPVPEPGARSFLPEPPPGGYQLEMPYTLLPGDRISVEVRDDPKRELDITITIPPEGEIEVWKSEPAEGMPLQRIRAVGKTVTELRDAIADVYQRIRFQFRPYVQVIVVNSVPRVVRVLGAVRAAKELVNLPRSGPRMTLWGAIQAAGGETEEADLGRVRISRKDPATGAEVSLPPFDLEEMRERSAFDRDPPLEPNDIVNVPKLGKVWISGHIGQPGSYLCRRGLTLSKLIAEAGDLKPFAKKGDIRVTRGEATVDERHYTVDYNDVLDGKGPDPLLLPGDRIWIDEDWK